MPMTTSWAPNLLVEGLRKVFFMEFEQQPLVYPRLFDIQKSRKNKETDHTVEGIGMLTEKPEGLPITYTDLVDGYEKEYTHKVFAKGIRATQEAIEDELYGVLGKRTKALSRAARYRLEYDHASLFNNATSSTYPVADGQALLSSAHPQAAVVGGTQDNYVSSDLSQAALESAITHFRKLEDGAGLLVAIEPKILLIPPELEFDAIEILKSSQRPYTGDNEVNSIMNRLEIVVWNHLTDADGWFVLSGKNYGAPISFERRPLSFDRDGDFDTGDVKMKCDIRYSYGSTMWEWCYGSDGA